MKKISFILLTCLMLIFGVTISTDRLNTIDTVNAASQTIDNMFSPYSLHTNNWLSYTASFNFNSNSYECWTDGTNIYFSSGSTQYVLDSSTSTWSPKTWTGLSSFYGELIWSDGTKIYYSSGSTHYELDISTSTWSPKTWIGLSSFQSSCIWTDGTNFYYSYGSTQYVLDISTSTWSPKTWTGLVVQYGYNVWTDGTDIYYSSGSTQYVLDISTSTWSPKTWTGLTDFTGAKIWGDGVHIYYSSGSTQYVLDSSTSTWSPKTWTGLTDFRGDHVIVLNDIVVIPNANSSIWYMLEKDTSGGGNNTDTYYHFTGSSYIMYGASSDLLNVNSYVDIWNSYFDIQDGQNNETVITLTSYGFKIRATSTAGDLDILNNVPVDYPTSYYSDTLTIYRETSYTNDNSDNFSYVYQGFRATTSGWTNSDIVGCTLSSELNVDASNTDYYYLIYNFHYFNSSNERLLLQIITRTSRSLLDSANLLPDNWVLWSERTIYFSANSGTDGTYQDGYNTGYADGQEIGYTNGYNAASASSYNTGYNEGYSDGDTNGYNRGYGIGFSAGVADANEYSFFGLISAVVDAPINAFTSLFNFNILGVNILNLITGLITFVILIAILKLILGGK